MLFYMDFLTFFKIPTDSHFLCVRKAIKISVVIKDYIKYCVILSSDICARFYALPKVHKINVPLKSVDANIDTSTFHF